MSIKISGLPGVTLLAQTDIFPCVANGVTSKITFASLNQILKTSVMNNDAGFLNNAGLVTQLTSMGIGAVSQLPSNTDLNTVQTFGTYQFNGGANAPGSSTQGFVQVVGESEPAVIVAQVFTSHGASPVRYTRLLYNGTWSAWVVQLDTSTFAAFDPSNALKYQASAGASQLLDLNTAAVFALNLNQTTCAITLANETPASNAVKSFSVMLKQGTGSNFVTWPSDIKWNYGSPPTLSYQQGMVDLITFITDPFSTSSNAWFGSLESSWNDAQ